MNRQTLPRVVYCGSEDAIFKKLSKYAEDYILEAKTPSFSGSPQKFARLKKASVLILRIKHEFDLKHQEWLSRSDRSIPIIVLCQNGTIETAVQVLQYQVFDYFSGLHSFDVMARRIEQALTWRSLKPQKSYVDERSDPLLLGSNPEIKKVNERAMHMASENKPVLVLGETGTGKEHLAYGIYCLSFKQRSPFIRYDCRLLQQLSKYDGVPVAGLVQSGMQEIKKKYNRGFLFLKHVEQLNPDQQGDILDLATTSSVKLVASYQEPALPLEKRPQGLSSLRIPALRQHKDDIQSMAEYFIRETAQTKKMRIKSLSQEMIMLMQEYPWPGNVQELANMIERMMMIESSNVLSAHSWGLCQGYGMRLNLNKGNQLSSMIEEVLKSSEMQWKKGALYEQFMEKMTRMLIDLVLPKVGYNQAIAAKILGISRNTLREKLRA
jgi:DNA-binding NtrC family response regulator